MSDVSEGDIEDFANSDNPDDVFDGDDQDKIEAFLEEYGKVCADSLGGGEG